MPTPTFTFRFFAIGPVIALPLGLGATALAQVAEGPSPGQGVAAEVLYSCRAIVDDQTRLACYDREVAVLQEAQVTGKVVIVEQEVIQKEKRGLFGFSAPRIALFKGDNDDEASVEELREIEDSLESFRFDQAGRALFTLSDGARWMQTDNQAVLGEPKPGDPVTIKTAALGSFKASINGRRAIRVKRVN